jgi:hypothetical protein
MSQPQPPEPADQLPDGLHRDEVLSLLRDRADPRARLALARLSTRFPDAAAEQSREIVADRRAPETLRSIAATELGHRAEPDNERALRDTLTQASSALLKHVARSLGRIGGEEAFSALGEVIDRSAAAVSTVRFARTLIGYRLGRDDVRIEPGELDTVTEPLEAEPTPLELLDLTEADVDAAWPEVTRELPATPMSQRGSLRFRCGNSLHWILLAEELGRGPAPRLRRTTMVAGAVLKYRECSDRFSLDEYLLTNAGDATIGLVGVRESGIVVHGGSVRIDDDRVSFALSANNPPYSRPIELSGLLDPGTGSIAFRRAVIGRARSAPPRARAPRRAVSPPG